MTFFGTVVHYVAPGLEFTDCGERVTPKSTKKVTTNESDVTCAKCQKALGRVPVSGLSRVGPK